jgi:hypothetical protein
VFLLFTCVVLLDLLRIPHDVGFVGSATAHRGNHNGGSEEQHESHNVNEGSKAWVEKGTDKKSKEEREGGRRGRRREIE